MKFPLKRSMPPVGNRHGSREAPRPNKNEIWEEAMGDEIDEPICPICGWDIADCEGEGCDEIRDFNAYLRNKD